MNKNSTTKQSKNYLKCLYEKSETFSYKFNFFFKNCYNLVDFRNIISLKSDEYGIKGLFQSYRGKFEIIILLTFISIKSVYSFIFAIFSVLFLRIKLKLKNKS